jgi:hypothetical protein
MDFVKFFLNFVTSLFLLTGQFYDRDTAAFRLFLSWSSNLPSNIMWSTVCVCVCVRAPARAAVCVCVCVNISLNKI